MWNNLFLLLISGSICQLCMFILCGTSISVQYCASLVELPMSHIAYALKKVEYISEVNCKHVSVGLCLKLEGVNT